MLQCQVNELRDLLNAKENINLIDVRSTDEFKQFHIDEAKHIPLHLLPMQADKIDDDKPVYIICLSGARSAQAAQWLAPQRTQPMINVAGGMAAWLQQGYPVENK